MKTIKLGKKDNSFEILDQWHHRFLDALPNPYERAKVKTRFGTTEVLKSGPESAIPIVLLHGAMAGAPFALNECGDLPTKHRFLALNIPGQSTKADPVRLQFKSGEYALWLKDVLDALAIDKACLWGVSWGGSVALHFAKDFPDRVHSLLLMVSASLIKGSAWQGFSKIMLPMMRFKLFPSEKNRQRAFANLFTSEDPMWSKYVVDAQNHFNMDFSVPPLVHDKSFQDFKAPVYVIAADRDVSFPGEKLIQRCKTLFPNLVGTHLLKNSNHCPSFLPEDRKNMRKVMSEAINLFFDQKDNC